MINMMEPRGWKPGPWGAGYAKGKKIARRKYQHRLAKAAMRILNSGMTRADVCRWLGLSPRTLGRWLDKVNPGISIRVRAGEWDVVTGKRRPVWQPLWMHVYEGRIVGDKAFIARLRGKKFRPSSRARYVQWARLRLQGRPVQSIADEYRVSRITVYKGIAWVKNHGDEVVKSSARPLDTGKPAGV